MLLYDSVNLELFALRSLPSIYADSSVLVLISANATHLFIFLCWLALVFLVPFLHWNNVNASIHVCLTGLGS